MAEEAAAAAAADAMVFIVVGVWVLLAWCLVVS